MGVTYRGFKKYLVVFLFVLPTLLGVALISFYPIAYNVYISLTNRNRFHYQVPEDPSVCDVGPDEELPMGVYCIQRPLLGNYIDLFEELVTVESLISLGRLALMVAPLILVAVASNQVHKRMISPPSTGWWWLVGLGLSAGLWLWLDVPGALDQLTDTGDFFFVIFRTLLYVLACIPLFFVTGLILALVLNNEQVRGRGVLRALLIVPWAVPSYISALIWQFFFRTEQGTINQILRLVGIQGPAWLQSDLLAFVAVVIINVWMSYPFFMTVILGALQSIPQEQYEAAEVDGANWWQKLTRITLPLIRPAVMPAIVLSSITTFQMFNTVWLVTRGGPIRGANTPGATEFVMIYAYQVFRTDRYADIGAFAVVIFLFLFALTLLSLRMTRITRGAYE